MLVFSHVTGYRHVIELMLFWGFWFELFQSWPLQWTACHYGIAMATFLRCHISEQFVLCLPDRWRAKVIYFSMNFQKTNKRTFGSNQVSANAVIWSGPPEQILLRMSSVWLAISSGSVARYILSTTESAVNLAKRCIIPSPRPTEKIAAPFYDIKNSFHFS